MRSLGQIAYEAYRDHAKGVSLVTGMPLPSWSELPPGIIDAWQAAGEAAGEAAVYER